MKLHFRASQSPDGQTALEQLTHRYGNVPVDDAQAIVALGGDGFMLETMHKTTDLEVPIYGMNRGTVGFLMNGYEDADLPARVAAAVQQTIHPLLVSAQDVNGKVVSANAINEVSVLRQGPQTANIKISIDGKERIDNLMCDGVLLSTPAGSTAYNYSAYGPILPISANVLALTPIAAFRPRRWRGAVLTQAAHVHFENIDPYKRPLMVNADSRAFSNIVSARVAVNRAVSHRLLFDPGHSLEERILIEQFQ